MVAVFLSFINCAKEENVPPADLVLLNGDIYTVDPDNPWAKSLVITGNTITAVCKNDKEARKFIGDETKVIDLEGKFVTPGIIDGHVHFNWAGALINDANLIKIPEDDILNTEVVYTIIDGKVFFEKK